MSPWEAIIEKVPEGCRTLLAAAAALAMTMMATMLALTADAHVLALVDDLLRENVQRLDLLGRQGRQDAIGYLGLRGAAPVSYTHLSTAGSVKITVPSERISTSPSAGP